MIEPASWDINLLMCLNTDGGESWDVFFYWVSDKFIWVPMYLGLLWGVYKKWGWRGIGWFVLTLALVITLADQTATFAKNNFSKFRPSHNPELQKLIHTGVNGYFGGLYGTISSHAANSIAVMILCCGAIGNRLLWWGMGVWVVLICYSRIYLGVHFPLDILLGLLEGAFWGCLGLFAWRKVVKGGVSFFKRVRE